VRRFFEALYISICKLWLKTLIKQRWINKIINPLFFKKNRGTYKQAVPGLFTAGTSVLKEKVSSKQGIEILKSPLQ